MHEDEVILKKRMLELANRSYRNNQFFFSGFLSPAEYSACVEVLEKEHCRYDVSGGTDAAERVMIRFGDKDEFGYEEEFPISCLVVKPALAKFADQLGHRDFLGSILNLGIERSVIGDIIIRDNVGYVLCQDKMAEYLAENLTKIKHTYVKCSITREMPEALKPKLETVQLSVTSQRCDLVIAKLYHLSRSDALDLFREKKIFVNGRVEESNSRSLKGGDVISARGFGKFIYEGVININKKDKLRIEVQQYV